MDNSINIKPDTPKNNVRDKTVWIIKFSETDCVVCIKIPEPMDDVETQENLHRLKGPGNSFKKIISDFWFEFS